MSFISDFFSVGGTGGRVLTTAGTIGVGIVENQGAQIKSDYELQLKTLSNDAAAGENDIKLQVAQADQERQAALAKAQDRERNDRLLAVAIVGGLIALAFITIKFLGNRSKKIRQS